MLEKSFFYKTVLLPSLQLILTFFLMNEPFSSHADPLRPKKADAPPLTPATALLDTIGGALKTIREESPVFYHQLELKMIEKKQTLAEKFLSELSPGGHGTSRSRHLPPTVKRMHCFPLICPMTASFTSESEISGRNSADIWNSNSRKQSGTTCT